MSCLGPRLFELILYIPVMLGSRNFCQRGSNFDNFFFVVLGDEMIKIALKAGHHWPASETPFKWRFAGVSMMA